ncbi:uncharacterized protein C16orf78 homolog [Tursiops truncatus]|uniref:Uncharacterized protein C16orf78 homolog n=1 Tax=Tursiops truncatus TaxID=9739 RepID=A0A2U3V393_TURTR|nr:uncharacterized protein C16orf78 homolog [Tursiops truncatus]
MTEQPEDLKDSLPTERKHVWRMAEERQMSDLARVLEWLERRQGKKKRALQKNKPKVVTLSAAPVKEEKKAKNVQKQQGGNHQVAFSKQLPSQASGQSSRKDGEASALYRRLYGVEAKGKRLSSMTPGNYPKDAPRNLFPLPLPSPVSHKTTLLESSLPSPNVIQPMATGGQQVLTPLKCSSCSETSRNHLRIQVWHPGLSQG